MKIDFSESLKICFSWKNNWWKKDFLINPCGKSIRGKLCLLLNCFPFFFNLVVYFVSGKRIDFVFYVPMLMSF